MSSDELKPASLKALVDAVVIGTSPGALVMLGVG
jgi:hypothetical protein